MDIPKILAFDYGLARIGVAISFGSLAEPLDILSPGPDLHARVQALIKKNQVEKIIVGVSEQEMARLSRQFGEEMAHITHLPVEYMDETLSSRDVQQRLYERNQGRQKYKGPIDHFAATVILQNYLDENYG
jgi:putative transcription antitermination factor YqgF